MSALVRFSSLLDAERAAALAADVDALAELQAQKREAIRDLEAERPTEQAQALIVRKARANVGLLRQLAELHHALLTGEARGPVTYGPDGTTQLSSSFSLRRL